MAEPPSIIAAPKPPDAGPTAQSADQLQPVVAPNGSISSAASAAQRAQMARALCALVVLPLAQISYNARALVADMLLDLLPRIDDALRAEIARRVARVRDCPPALVRELLLGEPGAAVVLLRSAEALPASLLIECARKGSTAHREAIARRHDLRGAVADALLETNEPSVANILLRREEVVFSPHALDLLTARSAADPERQALLLQRPELEPAHGFIMFWWAGPERRRRILSRFALDRTVIQNALGDLYAQVFGEAEADPLVKDILVMLDRRHRPRGVNGEPVAMDVVVRTIARARKFPSNEMLQGVGLVAGISRDLAARILCDPGGEAFAVLCKSVGMSRDLFYKCLLQPDAERVFDVERADALMGVFDGMARDFARAVLRYWDWSGNPRIAQIMRLLGLEGDGRT